MAEGIARAMLKDVFPESAGEMEFSSAGIAAIEGLRATRYAIAAARGFGADIRGHRARLLLPHYVEESDLVVVMEEEQARVASMITDGSSDERILMLSALSQVAPDVAAGSLRERLTSLMVLAAGVEDPAPVEDPIGGELPEYENVAGELAARLEDVLTALTLGVRS